MGPQLQPHLSVRSLVTFASPSLSPPIPPPLQLGVVRGRSASDIMQGTVRRFYPHSGALASSTVCRLTRALPDALPGACSHLQMRTLSQQHTV